MLDAKTTLPAIAADLERMTEAGPLWHGAIEALAAQGLTHVIHLTTSPDRADVRLRTTIPGLYDGFDPGQDPFLDWCCDSYGATLTGPDYLEGRDFLPEEAKALIRRSGLFGFRSGIAFPMRLTGSERFGGFNLGCGLDRATFEGRYLPRESELRFFCIVVHRRFEELEAEAETSDGFRKRLVAPTLAKLAELTPREREVMYLMSQGLSRKESARLCGIAPGTVAEHTKSAYRKLGINNRVDATRLMIEAEQACLLGDLTPRD
jgi:DNA-binding CsgD family transcriptional regulator